MTWPPQIGELLPRAEDAYGVYEKLAGYSLNVENMDGRHKAVLFRAVLDITIDDIDYLADTLIAAIADTPIDSVRDRAPYGFVCGARVSVRGLPIRSDRIAVVSTAWQIAFDGGCGADRAVWTPG